MLGDYRRVLHTRTPRGPRPPSYSTRKRLVKRRYRNLDHDRQWRMEISGSGHERRRASGLAAQVVRQRCLDAGSIRTIGQSQRKERSALRWYLVNRHVQDREESLCACLHGPRALSSARETFACRGADDCSTSVRAVVPRSPRPRAACSGVSRNQCGCDATQEILTKRSQRRNASDFSAAAPRSCSTLILVWALARTEGSRRMGGERDERRRCGQN